MDGTRVDLYRASGGGYGYNVNTPVGGSMGGLYPFKWMAWLAARSAARRVMRRRFGWGAKL